MFYIGLYGEKHEYSPCLKPSCLPNGQMLNRWLSEKNNSSVFQLRFRGAKNKCCMFCILKLIFLVLGRESKIGKCHAISYGSLRLWCK